MSEYSISQTYIKEMQNKLWGLKLVRSKSGVIKDNNYYIRHVWKDKKNKEYNVFSNFWINILSLSLEGLVIREVSLDCNTNIYSERCGIKEKILLWEWKERVYDVIEWP